MMITTVTILLVALSALTTNFIYQQQEALATQEDTSEPTTTASCGEVVEGLVELNSDLDCSEDGLIVGADETTVRLNGHTIMGPGRDSSKVGVKAGVSVENHDGVRIEGPGTIQQFKAGILASGDDGAVISGVTLEDNQVAIFSTATENLQAMQNIITRNNIGMASHSSSGLELRENLLTGNVLAGITFVSTDNSLLSKNDIRESENGIFVDADSDGNRIESNDVFRNKVDLNNANGLAINVNSNSFSENNCQTSNPSGLCTTAINALQPPQPSPQQSNTQEQDQEGKDKVVQKEEEQPLPQQQPEPRDNEDTTAFWDIQ